MPFGMKAVEAAIRLMSYEDRKLAVTNAFRHEGR